jgi:hypothetical protein
MLATNTAATMATATTVEVARITLKLGDELDG